MTRGRREPMYYDMTTRIFEIHIGEVAMTGQLDPRLLAMALHPNPVQLMGMAMYVTTMRSKRALRTLMMRSVPKPIQSYTDGPHFVLRTRTKDKRLAKREAQQAKTPPQRPPPPGLSTSRPQKNRRRGAVKASARPQPPSAPRAGAVFTPPVRFERGSRRSGARHPRRSLRRSVVGLAHRSDLALGSGHGLQAPLRPSGGRHIGRPTSL